MTFFRIITRLLLWLIMLLPILLQGCGRYQNNPVIDVDIGDHYPGLAVSAERRLILAHIKEGSGIPTICAEPSPDAAQALLSLFSLSGEQTIPTGQGTHAGITELIETTPFQLFSRSQGVQLYRDSIFALCQMAMNKWVSGSIAVDYSTQEVYQEAVRNYYQVLIGYNSGLIDNIPIFPEFPLRTEVEIALRSSRQDAKDIIIEEIRSTDTQRYLRETYAKLIEDTKNAKDATARAVSEAKLEILEKILKQLKINIETNGDGG